MKVLHVFKTYLPDTSGGIERVIFSIAEAARPLGVESEVLTLSRNASLGAVRVGSHLLHQAPLDLDIASTGLSWSVIGRFRALARGADIVHYHFPWPMMDLMQLAAPPGRPSLVTYHSDVVRQKLLRHAYAPLMHRFLAGVDRIVATSEAYVETSPVLQRYRDKVAVIPIGIADQPAPPEALVRQLRGRVGEGFFLFVGVLRYYKGIAFLIEAARRSGLPVVVVGDGEMRGAIEAAALPNLTLLGSLGDAEKAALLQLCCGFVFPSHLRSEAFGVALLEAAQAGRPMISCEIGTGTSWINRHEETGLVVPPADPAALAGAMRQLADAPERAAAMGQAARRRYEALFTADRMAAAYVDEYRRLLGR